MSRAAQQAHTVFRMVETAANDPLGLVGTLLERRYRIDARVAEGGFGVIYAGLHIGLVTPLAIKVLKHAPTASAAEWEEMVAHFLEEAKLIAKLRHPAVVSVMDAGITPTEDNPEGLPWIVMEWLDGETLASDLAQRRARGDQARTRAQTLELLRPVIEAVAEAHEAGIVHRDLNPNNLMLVPSGRATSVRVLDFGIAKMMRPDVASPATSTTTDATVRACSIAYAAPEQLSGARTGPWTDVHALALLFTEVLCGHAAIPVDDVDAHYRAAFAPTRPTPATFGVDVGDWESILATALALNPRDRYASAGEFLAALDGAWPAELSGATTMPGDRALDLRPSSATAARQLAPGPRVPRAFARIAAVTAAAVALAMAAAVTWIPRPGRRAGGPPAAALCTSNAACSMAGAPAICRPDVGCVALRSPDCEPLADARALDSDSTVWFGSMLPRTGPDAAAFGERETNAVELARRDFAQIMGGTSATGALDRARPFGLLACDDAVDPRRAAKHLVEDVGVPAVIGFYSSGEAIDLTTSLFLPNRVLAIASLNTNPLITAVPHPAGVPRLVWRTTYSNVDAAAALSALVAGEFEPSLRGGGVPGRAIRVAFLRPRNAAGLSDAFFAKLRFNGKTALDNGSNYRELTIAPEAPRSSPEYPQLARELVAFKPDIVLYSGNAAIVDALFAPLEAQWPRLLPRPRYASIALLPKELLEFVGTNSDRRRRFFGVTPVGSTTANARLVSHYNEVFPDKITRTIDPNASYDAFYLLAYATYAIPRGEKVTGERLSLAFGKLIPPGRPIDVGLAGIFDAYAALSNNESIDLTGATGRLDFDLATGESTFDQAILCVGVDEHGKASDGIESGLVYSATSKQLEGTMRCP
jgi:protein kinase-like protein